jgi:hypothetical protein
MRVWCSGGEGDRVLDFVAWKELLIHIAVAAAAGMLIGLEREWREKSAGFRTLTLVSTGSAIFVLAAVAYIPAEVERIMAGIATGIGFLGAGAIIQSRGTAFGLTTAASVWMASALGVACTSGRPEPRSRVHHSAGQRLVDRPNDCHDLCAGRSTGGLIELSLCDESVPTTEQTVRATGPNARLPSSGKRASLQAFMAGREGFEPSRRGP